MKWGWGQYVCHSLAVEKYEGGLGSLRVPFSGDEPPLLRASASDRRHTIGMLVASYYCGNFAGLNRPSSDDIQRCVLEEANNALSKASCHVPGLAVTLRPYETET